MKAVFIDRDGVINKNSEGYITRPEDFEFIPGTIKALKKLHESEFKTIIITNQGGIGKGEYTEQDLNEIHKEMIRLLEKENIALDGIYYCPHHPNENCDCRKPKLAMVKKAVKDHNIDLKKSFFIGDKTSDIQAGKNAGCKTFLVKTGYAGTDGNYNVKPDFFVSDLLEAVKRIIK